MSTRSPIGGELTTSCPSCGYHNPADSTSCGMCGELLRREPPPPASSQGPQGLGRGLGVPIPRQDDPCDATNTQVEHEREPTIAGLPRPLFFLLVGIPFALLFASGPFMRSYSWFLRALFHEFGHTVAGFAFGLPSFPAISLRGHAVTMHQEQMPLLVWGIWIALGTIAWRLRAQRAALVLMIAACVLYPLFAFTSAKEVWFLAGGHLGELAFAWLCLARSLTGGFTHGHVERGCYAALGWMFVGSNVGLCFGLATSPAARAAYAGNGSYGLTNDYIRLADDVFGCSLSTVTFVMLLVSLLPVPLAFLAYRLRR